jgi:hypothetical protein
MADPNQATFGNDKSSLDDSAQAAQNAGRGKNAVAEKDVQAALSQHDGASRQGVADSSPSSHGSAKLTVKGANIALQRQIIAHDFTNQVLAYLVTAAFFALIVLLMFSNAIMPKDTGAKDLLFILLGVVATGWANIIGFYFGSSVGSAQKSQTISSALLHGNPTESPSGS